MTYESEKHFIDAVHEEVLKYRKDEVGVFLEDQIKAMCRVTFRYLHELEERLDRLTARVRQMDRSDAA